MVRCSMTCGVGLRHGPCVRKSMLLRRPMPRSNVGRSALLEDEEVAALLGLDLDALLTTGSPKYAASH